MKFRRDKEFFLDDVSIISEGMDISGHVNTHGNIRVDGKIRGDVKAAGNITLGEKGEITGNIIGKSMTIGGKILGNVKVLSLIHI